MRPASVGWAVGAALVLLALGWQVLYELDIRKCQQFSDMANRPLLCAGPLDSWVLPLTLVAALMLIAMGVWRLVPPRNASV